MLGLEYTDTGMPSVEPLATTQFSVTESQLEAAMDGFALQLLEYPCDVALCGELGSGKTRFVKAVLNQTRRRVSLVH